MMYGRGVDLTITLTYSFDQGAFSVLFFDKGSNPMFVSFIGVGPSALRWLKEENDGAKNR